MLHVTAHKAQYLSYRAAGTEMMAVWPPIRAAGIESFLKARKCSVLHILQH